MKMRKAVVLFLWGALLLSLFTGCVTSTIRHDKPVAEQVSSSGKRVIANLEAANNGVFLFYYIPLWTGAPGRPNRMDWDPFVNQLGDKYMYRMLDGYSKRLKADAVEDVRLSESSTGMLGLWIFWRRTRSASAVAVMNDSGNAAQAEESGE